MSTFDGLLHHFPHIRVDHFRSSIHRPPLACFLSHVHSDHLRGLESLRAPFVYCSPATREILLRLEKYPHRMNFTKGILESRTQTYKHLKSLLKTIPLETPTSIELAPGNEIQVTLFDANHCVGAVMFLFQNRDGKAALYTGDIRAEPWWVDSLARHPLLLPYAAGARRLDTIYLDTTHASRNPNSQHFPSKAAGLTELLEKISQYPDDTIFHIAAWTFGYEDVWTALSAFLNSPIHLDRYRWSLYRSLLPTIPTDLPQAPEASPLVGFNLGNHRKNGCLTSNPHVRLHSCERGSGCPVIEGSSSGDDALPYIQILPIVKRSPTGTEIAEVGLGGGKGDLDQIHELEINDQNTLSNLLALCAARIADVAVLERVKGLLHQASGTEQGGLRFEAGLGDLKTGELEGMPLRELVDLLARLAGAESTTGGSDTGHGRPASAQDLDARVQTNRSPLPTTITFPYARHASYPELCHLVQTFRPRDIVPCTVDHAAWSPDVSMRTLFGHLCAQDAVFGFDAAMTRTWEERAGRENGEFGREAYEQDTQETREGYGYGYGEDGDGEAQQPSTSPLPPYNEVTRARTTPSEPPEQQRNEDRASTDSVAQQQHSRSAPSIRQWAHLAASEEFGLDWFSFGGLLCARDGQGVGAGEGEVEMEVKL